MPFSNPTELLPCREKGRWQGLALERRIEVVGVSNLEYNPPDPNAEYCMVQLHCVATLALWEPFGKSGAMELVTGS